MIDDKKYAREIGDGMQKYGLEIDTANRLTGIGIASDCYMLGREAHTAREYFTVPEFTTMTPCPGSMQWIPPDYDFTPRDVFVEVEATDRINIIFKDLYQSGKGVRVLYKYRESVFKVYEDRVKRVVDFSPAKLKKRMDKHGSGVEVLMDAVKKLGMADRLRRGRGSFAVPM